ncbi:MAG: hypothetical protein AVDCRST_MAG32-2585, partial [uncultured Nocardioides sp.]
DDHELLVVAAERPDALVEQHLAAGRDEVRGEPAVLEHVVAQRLQVRAPQQPAHPGAAPCRRRQRPGDGRPVVRELLVAVATPAQEQHLVAGPGRRQSFGEGGVVGGAVHAQAHRVALGPGPQARGRVAALVGGEEPVLGAGLPARGVAAQRRAQPRQQLLAVRGVDERRRSGGPAGRPVVVGLLVGVARVEDSAQGDRRHPPRVVAGEPVEQHGVVPPVVADQDPRRVGAARGQTRQRGALVGQTPAHQPPGEEPPPGHQRRARGVVVVPQRAQQRAGEPHRQGGQVEHLGVGVVGRHRQQPLHAQQRPAVPGATGEQGGQPAPQPPQGRDPQDAVDVVDDPESRPMATHDVAAGAR